MMPRMRMPMRPMGPRGMRPRGPGPRGPVPRGPVPPGVRPGARPLRPGGPQMRPRMAPPRAPQPVPAPSATGNATNDPSTANKRVFVGNLNTIAISKEEVQRIFGVYGIITGISMHKGYAFVQFAYEHEARVACGNEDSKTYAGQKLDCNIASEPKNSKKPEAPVAAISTGVKRPASTLQPMKTTVSVGIPPVKKLRQDPQPTIKRTLVSLTGNDADIKKTTVAASAVRKAAARDILICGNCRTMFPSLHSLAQHKKVPCKLRFSTTENFPPPETESSEPTSLQCGTCNADFSSAWPLIQHCQDDHSMNICRKEGQPAPTEVATVEEVVEEVVVVQAEENVNGQ